MYWLVMAPILGNLLIRIGSHYIPVFSPYAGNIITRNTLVLSILK